MLLRGHDVLFSGPNSTVTRPDRLSVGAGAFAWGVSDQQSVGLPVRGLAGTVPAASI